MVVKEGDRLLREMIFAFLVVFFFIILSFSAYFYLFKQEPQANPAEIFSSIHERCRGFVESDETFDADGLAEGDVLPGSFKQTNQRAGRSVWHDPDSLIVVSLSHEDLEKAPKNKRQCKISLSGSGERPPVSTIGLVTIEFFAIRHKLIRAESHVEYTFNYPVQEQFAFRSKKLDRDGCATMHLFVLGVISETFYMTMFRTGIACNIS